MHALVTTVYDNGEIVYLSLQPSPEMWAEQARVVAQFPDQLPFQDLHITLGPSIGAFEVTLPLPPARLEFAACAELVKREDKTPTYLKVSEQAQQFLTDYVRLLESIMNTTGFYDPSRVFHASLTNLTGTSRGSIAKIWRHEPEQI